MAFLIGTDEAGYGPNLGPLVIAATVWQTPGGLHNDGTAGARSSDVAGASLAAPLDLYQVLQDAVCLTPTRDERIAIADSKQLHRPGGDLRQLHQGVLASLACQAQDISPPDAVVPPTSLRELGELISPEVIQALDTLPWYADYNPSVEPPQALSVKRLKQSLTTSGIRLIGVRARTIYPKAFNEGVARFDSKGSVLSMATLDLVADLVERLPNEPISIVCDKHGGRNKYGPLLQPRFGDRLVRVVCEGRRSSQYEIGTEQRSIDIRFEVGGESFLPSALASMTAKYLRELCMNGFNAYWQRHVDKLRPTAGYPVDAKRFKREIAAAQIELGIDDHCLWRSR